MSIRDSVLTLDDTQKRTVDITAWGVTVEMRGMSLSERGDYIRRIVEANDREDDEALKQLDAEIISKCLFDPETGERAFTDADIPILLTKSAAVMAPLSKIAQVLSGLDAEAESRLGKDFSTSVPVETAVPATEPSPSADSSSLSPES